MGEYIYEEGLESERLKTRFLTESDISLWTPFFEDEEAVEFIPNFGALQSADRSKHWIERQLKRYADRKFGLQLLTDKQNNEVVGQCGLLEQTVDGETKLEVGYHIFKKYWGRGYAPEAAKRFMKYAFDNDLSADVISIIHVDNVKSQRVAQKNGLSKIKQSTWNDLDVFIFQIEKEKWDSSR